MFINPLLHHTIRHPESDLVMEEGELDAATPGERLLIAPFHTHHNDDEMFYVISGEIGFIVGDNEFIAPAGSAVLVPRGAIHTWWNATETPSRYLMIVTRRIDQLVAAIHNGPRSPEEMTQLFADHDSTLIGWTR